jgi:ABC-type nitrate/sulfonate/bicarbonate transport system permease component
MDREAARRLARRRMAVRLGSLAVILVVWEIYGRSVNPVLFTYPSAVAVAFFHVVRSGELWQYGRPSLQVLVAGFLAGVVVGIPLGVAMARYRFLDWALEWPVDALYATPTVALVPLIVIWFGFDVLAKSVIVFLFVVFSVLINTYQGVKVVDPRLLEVGRSFCSSERRMWADIVLPSALPFIVSGIRLGVGRALVGMVIAEFYTSISGIGYMITRYADQFQTAYLFVPIVLLAGAGVLLSSLLAWLELRIAPWARSDR